jgi:hypothetical protein
MHLFHITFFAGIWRNLVRERGKGIEVKEPVHVHMNVLVIVNREERGTVIKIVIGHRKRTRWGTGKETVIMIVIGVIKINTDIMVVTMIEGGSLNALVTAMVTGLVTMSMQATNGAATSWMSTIRKTHMVRCQPTIKHSLTA